VILSVLDATKIVFVFVFLRFMLKDLKSCSIRLKQHELLRYIRSDM